MRIQLMFGGFLCLIFVSPIFSQQNCQNRYYLTSDKIKMPEYYRTCYDFTFLTPNYPFCKMEREEMDLITFESSHLNMIPRRSFTSCRYLRRLALTDTRIIKLEAGSFYGLTNLEALYLRHNLLEELPKGCFESLKKLRVLDLSNNKLYDLSDTSRVFSDIESLETIYLSENLLRQISDSTFKNLKKLIGIDVSQNRLASIAEYAFSNLADLQYVNLRQNQLTYIPSQYLNRLKDLDVSTNRLRILDLSSFSQGLLTSLNASFNELWNDSIDWSRLKNVQNVDLSHVSIHHIGSVPSGILYLNVSYNNIYHFGQSSFVDAIDLYVLDLSHNNIKTIRENSFETLKKLLVLRLDNNQLTEISPGTFKQLLSLKELRLSDNYIKNLQFGTFSGLNKLTSLHLNNNRLLKINEHSFLVTPHLVELNLANNYLTTLDTEDLLLHLEDLVSIDIRDNKWTCMSLVYLTHYLKKRRVAYEKGIKWDQENIHGIACKSDEEYVKLKMSGDFPQDEEHVAVRSFEKALQNSELHKLLTADYSNIGLFGFLQNGFKNTKFYKFFERDFTKTNFYAHFFGGADKPENLVKKNKNQTKPSRTTRMTWDLDTVVTVPSTSTPTTTTTESTITNASIAITVKEEIFPTDNDIDTTTTNRSETTLTLKSTTDGTDKLNHSVKPDEKEKSTTESVKFDPFGWF